MARTKFKFISDAAGGDQFTVVSFTGREAISSLYRYEIELKAPLTAGIDLNTILQDAVRFESEIDGQVFPVHGVLASFDEMQTVQDEVYYRAELVPKLWRLSTYVTNEIYTTEETVDKIIEQVFRHAQFEEDYYDLSGLVGNLLVRDYVCQFGESDFDFISRLMENEGIFYYFEQSDAGPEKMILVNDLNYDSIPSAGLIYDVTAKSKRQHDCISAWSCRKQSLPSSVTVRDFNPDMPSQDIANSAPIDAQGQGTDYLYGCHVNDVAEATYLAEIRAEEHLCRKTRYYGESGVVRLQPGRYFGLQGHPNANYNNAEYLVVEVNHEGEHIDMVKNRGEHRHSKQQHAKHRPEYRNSFVAINAEEQYRPPRKTPKPRFYGTMTAFIYSETTSLNAEVDQTGHYRVLLPFDRADGGMISTDPNRKASAWVRMAQPYVGRGQGMYFPLAGGTEVLLTFINGDPDQPIISGALPNSAQQSLLDSHTNMQRTITNQVSQQISGNTHRISQNSAIISANEAALAAAAAGIQGNATDIQGNATDIQGNATDIQSNATDIQGNATDIAELLNRLDNIDPDPAVGGQIYINQDLTEDSLKNRTTPLDLNPLSSTSSMLPPWTGKPMDDSAAYSHDIVKFKFYNPDFTTRDLALTDIDEGREVDPDEVSTDRGAGDNYVYANGRTFAYPQHERVYFIGTFHEDFHVKDDFLDATKSWTGIEEQFNFPAPGATYPTYKDAENKDVPMKGDTHTDREVNPNGIRGVSEDKRWGDQMTYAWGRSFNWSAGKQMGEGGAFGAYNYGNGYTENLIVGGSGTWRNLYTDHKDKWEDDNGTFAVGWAPESPLTFAETLAPIAMCLKAVAGPPGLVFGGVQAAWRYGLSGPDLSNLAKEEGLNPNYTAVEKTFGHTYSYQMGLGVDIHEGNSISRTYGNSDERTHGDSISFVEGDSATTVIGTSSDAFIGSKYEFNLGTSDSMTVGINNELKLSIDNSIHLGMENAFQFAGFMKLTIGAGVDITQGPIFEGKQFDAEAAIGKLETKVTKMENTQVVLKNRTTTMIKDATALETRILRLENPGLLVEG